jgi:hypothetical protein
MPEKPLKRRTQRSRADDFKSVAKRLECDEDKGLFEKRLYRIAQAKTGQPRRGPPAGVEEIDPTEEPKPKPPKTQQQRKQDLKKVENKVRQSRKRSND